MIFDRLTWVGFIIVALGWALLVSATQLVELFASFTGHFPSPNYLYMPTIALCTVITGFGLAILGALQTGFGTLNKFFNSVLERTAKPDANKRGDKSVGRQEQPRKIVERGWLRDRAYVLFVDGSVEIETLLGRRLFPSLQDAQEFIA
jgi:prepilin-type processing-associated H-X9-DG protein